MDTSNLFDNAVSDKEVQILKTALPYFPASNQRLLSLFIVAKELKQTLQYVQTSGNESFGICSVAEEKRNPEHLLNDLRGILSPTDQAKLDQFLTIIQLIRTMEVS